jgi:FkbH-like protein
MGCVDCHRVLGVADIWLQRAEWQPTVFAEELRRLDLLKLEAGWPCESFRLRVHRNQAFEFVASVLGPFLAFGGRRAEIGYSEYDDSLALQVEGQADVELLWIDFDRYGERLSSRDLAAWFGQRVQALRGLTDAPILIADSPAPAATELNDALRRLAQSLPGVSIVPLSEIGAALGPRAFDRRAARITGMPLSDAACLRTARALGLVWLPAALGPRLKAIALDLDHTLYAGVLGEDGPAGVQLSPAHAALQRRLLELREQGLFLAIVSRNEPEDVDRLFAKRPDLPLRPEHFSARSIAFRDKAAGIREIAAALRIAPDAILFLDDNPGEIAAVASEVAGLKMLHAVDPALAARALDFYPGLHGYARDREDTLRVADLAAAAERAQATECAESREAYIRSLGVVLTLDGNPTAHLARLAALSNKTNQFNTGFLRLSDAQVAKRLADPGCRTISIALRDRLSDSGIVGALFTHRDGRTLVVDEVVISCRALGRNIEQAMVTEGLRRALRDLPAGEVRFDFREGPRNAPARAFLAEYAGLLPGADCASLPWDEARASESMARLPVSIVHEEGP